MVGAVGRENAVIYPVAVIGTFDKYFVACERFGAKHYFRHGWICISAWLEHPFEIVNIVDVSIQVDVRFLRLE